MTFFDKLRHTAEQLTDGASRQVQIVKVQGTIGKLSEEVDRNYAEIGKRARELYRRKEILDGESGVLVEGIQALEAEVEEARLEVQKLQQPAPQAEASGPEGAAASASTGIPQSGPPETLQTTPPQVAVPPASPPPAPPVVPPQSFQPPAPAAPEAPIAEAQEALCPECGQRVKSDARFCDNCGTKLAGA